MFLWSYEAYCSGIKSSSTKEKGIKSLIDLNRRMFFVPDNNISTC